jgi:hypothetical protein
VLGGGEESERTPPLHEAVTKEEDMSQRAVLLEELAAVGPEAFTSRQYRPHRVLHLVLFRFRSDVSADLVAETASRFLALTDSPREDGQPYIQSIDAGTQRSGEEAGHGFEHAFVVTFASEGDRNYYVGEPIQPDPRWFDGGHAAFKEFVGPLLADEGALVFDLVPGAL